MARFLVPDEYPHGGELGAILQGIRTEILKASHRMTHDGNPQTRHLAGPVIDCNENALELLGEAMGPSAVPVRSQRHGRTGPHERAASRLGEGPEPGTLTRAIRRQPAPIFFKAAVSPPFFANVFFYETFWATVPEWIFH